MVINISSFPVQVTVAGAGGMVSPRQFIVVSQVFSHSWRGHICVIFYLFHQGGWREEIFVLAGRGVQLAGIGTAPGIVTAEVFFIVNVVLYS